MSSVEVPAPPAQLPEMRWLLRQLRGRAIRAMLPPLLLGGLLLLGFPGRFSDPARGEWLGILLWLVAALAWGLDKLSSLASGWGLALGCLVADLLVVSWGGVGPATYLLALPAALASLAVSVPAGAVVASMCTGLLVWAPAGLLPGDPTLRVVTLVAVWGVFGLIWLTLQPLLTALRWSWSSYEQSRNLLDRARDYQVQLKQTLKDLADANLQLTRLNRLAQALRQEAENARAAKEQFVANVSHELRTPLNMIVGFSEMIIESPETYGERIPPALLADLEIILRNSQHLSDLIDDVLDLSQIEARRMALTSERVLLAEIVGAAALAVRPLFDSKGLYLRTDVPDGLAAHCDRTRIREVVLNLLSNAGRFTERGGVELRAWQDGREVVVSVADTGPGIAAEDREKLFRPFQQLDGSVRRRYGGTGLGLA
ncbi:MAG: HAMP domain-containing sensor histidine kinase, partial [Anaerolineae bacterium]|nr:HAMP domain-containing sensor histidine kinase [Anaerolineae bacterium]